MSIAPSLITTTAAREHSRDLGERRVNRPVRARRWGVRR
jgi:hypothetical protein